MASHTAAPIPSETHANPATLTDASARRASSSDNSQNRTWLKPAKPTLSAMTSGPAGRAPPPAAPDDTRAASAQPEQQNTARSLAGRATENGKPQCEQTTFIARPFSIGR